MKVIFPKWAVVQNGIKKPKPYSLAKMSREPKAP
jgi:hypothetical protein